MLIHIHTEYICVNCLLMINSVVFYIFIIGVGQHKFPLGEVRGKWGNNHNPHKNVQKITLQRSNSNNNKDNNNVNSYRIIK